MGWRNGRAGERDAQPKWAGERDALAKGTRNLNGLAQPKLAGERYALSKWASETQRMVRENG